MVSIPLEMARSALDALHQQETAIGAMSRLLNVLLDISKLESGAIRPEPANFTVAGLFAEPRAEFADLAAAKGPQFEIDGCDDQVQNDPSLAEQIMRNLVSNAIRYTREGFVRLRCLHESALVRIEVLDTGVGIPGDQMAFIFDAFYQLGVPANTARNGYGLGLSIVKRPVEGLTLGLDVRSEVGKGSAFSLVLPAGQDLAAPLRCAAGGSPLRGSTRGKGRVLLVEDDSAVRGATRMLLKAEGYQVTAVAWLAHHLSLPEYGGGLQRHRYAVEIGQHAGGVVARRPRRRDRDAVQMRVAAAGERPHAYRPMPLRRGTVARLRVQLDTHGALVEAAQIERDLEVMLPCRGVGAHGAELHRAPMLLQRRAPVGDLLCHGAASSFSPTTTCC